ncbi:hypothetical protein [Microbacterium sp.]|uniref:hypothetical protein n=1 Tax=Microbacterium sp. TaxID=51671 RepID=UPI0026374673|nr:hypothetical protein [Microbacterium sp.]
MSDYTPSLDNARVSYIVGQIESAGHVGERPMTPTELKAEFDRMIDAVRAEEREKAAQIAESEQIEPLSSYALWRNIAARIREQAGREPCNVCGRDDGRHKMSCRPQNRADADREPSDDEVEAAAEVFWEYDMVDDYRRERARAALLAAQEVSRAERRPGK